MGSSKWIVLRIACLQSKVQVLAREIESLKLVPSVHRRPQKTEFLGLVGSKQDPLDLYTKQVEELIQKIKDAQLQSVQATKVSLLFCLFVLKTYQMISAISRSIFINISGTAYCLCILQNTMGCSCCCTDPADLEPSAMGHGMGT